MLTPVLIVAVIGHVGHLLVDIPLFLGPVLLIMAALTVHTLHARRSEAPSQPAADEQPDLSSTREARCRR